MKKLHDENPNTPEYWDVNQTAVDFGLRQKEYKKLAVGDSILDVGCGISPFLSKIRLKTRVGLDFSSETVRVCAEMFKGVAFVLGSATKLPFVDNQFDTVLAGEIIEHLDDPKALLKEMRRVAKKRIIISTPILEFDDPEHIWGFDLEDLKELVGSAYEIKSNRFPGRSYLFAFCDL